MANLDKVINFWDHSVVRRSRNQRNQQVEISTPPVVEKKYHLTNLELETLNSIALGLSNQAIAKKHHLSLRGVNHRVACIANKLLAGEHSESGIRESNWANLRCALVFQAIRLGVIDINELLVQHQTMVEFLRDQELSASENA